MVVEDGVTDEVGVCVAVSVVVVEGVCVGVFVDVNVVVEEELADGADGI